MLRATAGSISRERLTRRLPVAFFLASALILLVLLLSTAGRVTDSDAAAELMLGRLLSQDGRLSPLSRNWYYSTELRVANSQIVYALLFHLTDSFYLVRLLGSIILCALLVLSFGVLCRGAGLSSAAFWLGSGVLLLPVSTAYARIVLMHSYYASHLILSFLWIGLVLRLYRAPCSRREKLIVFALLLVGFVSGLGGPRAIAMTAIPFTIAVIYRFLPGSRIRRADFFLLAGLIAMVAGYLCNDRILADSYHYQVYGDAKLSEFQWLNVRNGAAYILDLFGYRAGSFAFSAIGMASVAGIISAGIMLWGSWRAFTEKGLSDDPAAAPLSRLYLCAVVSVQIIGHLVYSVYYSLYYIPVVAFALPSYLALLHRQQIKKHTHRVLLVFTLVSMLVNGAITAGWFATGEKGTIRYGGLSYQNPHIVQDLEGVRDFLYESGTVQGYSTFWYANVLAEMSNGEITPLSIHVDKKGGMTWNNWLTSPLYRTPRQDTAYLLLAHEEEPALSELLSSVVPIAKYEDRLFSVYILPSGLLADWVH